MFSSFSGVYKRPAQEMDAFWETVSVKKFAEFTPVQKEELHEAVLNLSEVVKEIPKKSLRKVLEISLAVLRFKGEQIKTLEEKLENQQDSQDEANNERIIDENDKLKRMLENLEDENAEQNGKIKQLTEELLLQQKRLQDAVQTAELSDKDSSDPLSELEKHEDLLRNIQMKNKHIKRLLKEVELLQNQNIEQSKRILQLENDIKVEKSKAEKLLEKIESLEGDRKALKDTIKELNKEVTRLESNVTYLEEEGERSESDLKSFIEKLEIKAQSWKNMLDEKEKELRKLREKCNVSESSISIIEKQSVLDTTDTLQETSKLLDAIEIRDKQIEELDSKLKAMAEEMMRSTKLLNRISTEREDERNPQNQRACCKAIERSLQASNERCRELSQMLERTEEDNALKAKQALQAITALESYQRGEDGLLQMLQKCNSLEHKISSRDKQIRALVMELNSMHEITYENRMLRKRLNIPDDVIISAKNLAAKERNKEKIIDRLTLKLRSSEEMRLQLKLEKNELRCQMLELEKKIKNLDFKEHSTAPSEIGEVTESNISIIEVSKSKETMICAFCQGKPDDEVPSTSLFDLQNKYHDVLEENDTLRTGMHEILEKLRDYNASSDHITVDASILARLLKALQTRSMPGTPLKPEWPRTTSNTDDHDGLLSSSTETDEIISIQDTRQGAATNANNEIFISMSAPIGTFTRPATPKDDTSPRLTASLDERRSLQQQIKELEVYRKYYEKYKSQVANGENIGITTTTPSPNHLLESVTNLEVELAKSQTSYAFMREDFDRVLTETKCNELRRLEESADLKKELSSKSEKINELEKEIERLKAPTHYSIDDYNALLKSNADLRAQIAFVTDQILSGKLQTELKISDICCEYGVIQDNYELDFITKAEYEQQANSLKTSKRTEDEMQSKIKRLEDHLEIANEQIRSQQKLLMDITDNHINLRHLVADLQSTSEEKLLITKIQRDLECVKHKLSSVENERDELQRTCTKIELNMKAEHQKYIELETVYRTENQSKDLKIKFLVKSMHILKTKYSKFTPLIFLTNFVFAYKKFTNNAIKASSLKHTLGEGNGVDDDDDVVQQKLEGIISAKIEENKMELNDANTFIKLIKCETQLKLIEENCNVMKSKCSQLEDEISEQRIRYATETQHWNTIEALFNSNNNNKNKNPEILLVEASTNTETIREENSADDSVKPKRPHIELVDKNVSPIGSPLRSQRGDLCDNTTQTTLSTDNEGKPSLKICDSSSQTVTGTMESHAVQTVDANEIFTETETIKKEGNGNAKQLLEATKKALAEANKKIKELEGSDATHSEELPTSNSGSMQQSDVIEKTVTSFNAMLTEKDKSINKYQDTLQSEREQHHSTISKLNIEIDDLRSTVTNLNFNIKAKDMEILELKTKLEALSIRRNSNEKLDLAAGVADVDENVDNSLNELTDEKIEEMFQQNDGTTASAALKAGAKVHLANTAMEAMAKREDEGEEEKQDLEKTIDEANYLKQIKDLGENLKYIKDNLKVKDEEIAILREKLKLCQEREKTLELMPNPEVERLRAAIDEKDKHINELVDTLKSFHDDQQSYIKNSNDYSTDQISKLSTDLTRIEATNKIYQTQVEALRRQVTSLQQREKQARELNQSLRNQLIKRPVVSIKTELNTRVKTEGMQKRIQQLELELEEARAQIQRQQIIIDTKRAKSASEVGLWEKQKRWQQSAEKLKTKLEETEVMLEKTRALLQTAKNTISRLEKDKQNLESRLTKGRGYENPMKCCQSANAPYGSNCRNAKYTPSESPETYTGPSSECSSPSHSTCENKTQMPIETSNCCGITSAFHNQHAQNDLVTALKARIELQQRKIIAMELEGKGNNILTAELEKLQEKLSAIEAQNVRLEAKNLQLQLDNDLLRQGDTSERLEKRIKHLEDYIIALKEEIAQSEARRVLCKCSGIKISTLQGQPAEQTILSLRNLVEKLHAENKYLKDGRRSAESKLSTDMTGMKENKLQKLYSESLDKISLLQSQLDQKTKCPHCTGKSKGDLPPPPGALEELKVIKEQLSKKTELLQKAKVLLTRAAAKEKVLKEQLTLWKRKCFELQNVPVIDEISE